MFLVDSWFFVSIAARLYRYFRVNDVIKEQAKKKAAHLAVTRHVRPHTIVGIGSGNTVVYAVKKLGELLREKKYHIKCIPSSFQTRHLIVENDIPITNLSAYPEIDLFICGADAVDGNLNMIKGSNGCFLLEKVLASCSGEVIMIGDHGKYSKHLGSKHKLRIPIEVNPEAYVPVRKMIKLMYGGTVTLRMAVMKAGPAMTDNGNFILDWTQFDPNHDWEQVNMYLNQVPGILETGLFPNVASRAYLGRSNGTVRIIRKIEMEYIIS